MIAELTSKGRARTEFTPYPVVCVSQHHQPAGHEGERDPVPALEAGGDPQATASSCLLQSGRSSLCIIQALASSFACSPLTSSLL